VIGVSERVPREGGLPFGVTSFQSSAERVEASVAIMASAYGYLSGVFDGFCPQFDLIVAGPADWPGRSVPYGMPFFRDAEDGQPAFIAMPASAGDFWRESVERIGRSSASGLFRLREQYPDASGTDVDLQPFFDLITVHELGHAFETQGGLALPTYWLGEIFANLALHAFVRAEMPGALLTLETFSAVGAADDNLSETVRRDGISTLDEFESHYSGSSEEMSTANYLWFQYRFQGIAARVLETDGSDALQRLWHYFSTHSHEPSEAAPLAPRLGGVSTALSDAIANW
jgi:hypothetical protein